MTAKKEKAIRRYVNKRIKEFKSEVLQIALEKDHPYINTLLNRTIYKYKRSAEIHAADISIDEEFKLLRFEYGD